MNEGELLLEIPDRMPGAIPGVIRSGIPDRIPERIVNGILAGIPGVPGGNPKTLFSSSSCRNSFWNVPW